MKKFFIILSTLFITSISAWSDEPWEPQEYFSPDGKYRVIDQTGGLISKKWNEETVLFTVYEGNTLFDEIKIAKVFKNPRMVEYVATVSHFHWGCFVSIDNEGINLLDNEGEKKYIFETKEIQSETHQSQLTYDELESLINKALPLVKNKRDVKKISKALKTIKMLFGQKGINLNNGHNNYDLFKSGKSELKIINTKGPWKGAGSHSVKTAFRLKTSEINISFFITDDDCDLYIVIHGGGDKENFKGRWGEDFDYLPERFYEFNTKTSYVRTGDYYPD